jgi:hypothetical protein
MESYLPGEKGVTLRFHQVHKLTPKTALWHLDVVAKLNVDWKVYTIRT